MNNFLKVAIFSLLTVGAFTAYSNFGIPQIVPAPPPVEEKLDLGAMTMDQFIALGDKIYHGKGTCTLCHNELLRAPLLDDVGAVSEKHMADPRYEGEATNVEEYLHESFVKPSAYVVAGFGKAGSKDTESPMPDVSGGGIGLSEAEISAIIAYLQDISGIDVTVSIPTDVPEENSDEESEGGGRAPLESPEAIIAEFTCGACHKIAGEEGDMGPDLTHIGALRDKDHLRRSILDPNVEITDGFMEGMMPDTYGDQLSAKELEMLVDYMAGLK